MGSFRLERCLDAGVEGPSVTRQECRLIGTRLVNDQRRRRINLVEEVGDVCLIAHTSHLEKGVRGTIPVRDVAAGNFIVSDGTAGAVQILLNGTTLAGIHGTRIVIPASGKLALRVLLETQSESSLVVYECYDRFTDDGKNMRSIACRPELIP